MSKYTIHGLNISSNTWKTVYVAEELGIDYEYVALDLAKGEQKTPEHLARHPFGKLPTLSIDGDHIFESNAICRFLAIHSNSSLYGSTALAQAKIDQWMNFFTCHLGAAFNSYTFETVAKKMYNLGEPNQAAADKAMNTIQQQLPVLDKILADSPFLAGEQLSIADLYAFAYSENAVAGDIPLEKYPAFQAWFAKISNRESIRRAHHRLGR